MERYLPPSHVVDLGSREIDEQINSFSLLKGKDDDYRSYGFKDDGHISRCLSH
jgi:hypothetical protein